MELSGIPCIHVISVMFLTGEKLEDYVDECYSNSTQMKIYSNFISPINDSNQWRSTAIFEPILSPMIKRPPRRPYKKRRKEANEKTKRRCKISKKCRKLKCSKCGKACYNVRKYRGDVGGNNKLDATVVARRYTATPTTGSQTKRTVDKLSVSNVTC